jgi:hypothetical protein
LVFRLWMLRDKDDERHCAADGTATDYNTRALLQVDLTYSSTENK